MAHQPGQSGIGYLNTVFFLQAFLDPDQIAPATGDKLPDQLQVLFIPGTLALGSFLRSKRFAHCIAVYPQEPGDLPDTDLLLMHLADGLPHLRRKHC